MGTTIIPYALINTAQINDGQGNTWERTSVAIINGICQYLPLIQRLN